MEEVPDIQQPQKLSKKQKERLRKKQKKVAAEREKHAEERKLKQDKTLLQQKLRSRLHFAASERSGTDSKKRQELQELVRSNNGNPKVALDAICDKLGVSTETKNQIMLLAQQGRVNIFEYILRILNA